MNSNETWESLGDIAARLAAKLEEDNRRVFERECRDDGIYRQQSAAKVSEGVAS